MITKLSVINFTISINWDSVTKNYFENLVRALENGLADVDSHAAACSKTTSSNFAGGASKGKGGRGKGSSRTGGAHDTVR